jgi:hypothetical protein
MKWVKRFFRWLWNKNELEEIRRELAAIHLTIRSEIERREPKRHKPVGKVGPIQNR